MIVSLYHHWPWYYPFLNYPQLHPLPLVIPRCVYCNTHLWECHASTLQPCLSSSKTVLQSVLDANLGHTKFELTSIKSNSELGHESANKNTMSDLPIPWGFNSMFKIIATNKQHPQQTAPEFDRGWHWTLRAIGRNENPDWHSRVHWVSGDLQLGKSMKTSNYWGIPWETYLPP